MARSHSDGDEAYMADSQTRFLPLAAKTILCHSLTYFLMEELAAHYLDYPDLMARCEFGMRQIADPSRHFVNVRSGSNSEDGWKLCRKPCYFLPCCATG